MLNIIPASQRHFADHGWLKTNWLFSFSEYYDPKNVHHGVLRVFNDDIVAAGEGFGMHPHKDMEIVTIVLKGEVSHEDSMGNKTTIQKGEVQRMSAGTGIYHSEMNKGSEDLHLYQLWIIPKKQGITPSYEQKKFDPENHKNKLMAVVAPVEDRNNLFINQDTTIYLADFEKGHKDVIKTDRSRKVFIYVTSGKLEVNGNLLNTNDQARIDDEETLEFNAEEDTRFIVIDAVAN